MGGRFKEQLKWELEDPYVALIFVFSFLLLAVTFYTNLFDIDTNVMTMGGWERPGSTRPLGLPCFFRDSPISPQRSLPLLGFSSHPWPSDTTGTRGVAKSVYSLPPLRNYEVVLAKFIAVFVVLFLSAFSAALVAYLYSYGDSPTMIKEGMLGQRYLLIHILYWLEAALYVSSLSSMIAVLSPPGTFAAILGGITVMYVPEILGWDFLLPEF
ncbi:hypothetical protein [Thermococcus sp. JCM 11816]|uniref:hypothetical protein n=1 Tax=Thermococcus sp. (strain JCM 11816 / KS-1) TaxID=1295125 RepID=UPI0006CF33AC